MEFQNFGDIINNFKKPCKLNKYLKKEIFVLKEFINELNSKIDLLSNILEKENEQWNSKYTIERFKKVIDKYKNSNIEINHKFGIGNIVAITNGDPYLHLELIINAIISRCKIMIIANPTLINFNLYITQIVREVLKQEELDEDLISIVNTINYRSKIIENQKFIDCVVINKDYEEYNFFTKKMFSKIIYLDYGNINIYVDSEEFENKIEEIVNLTYGIDISVYKYKIDNLEKFFSSGNNSFIFNTAVIFSNDIKKSMDFYELIKARNIFINKFDINEIETGLDINDFLFDKKVIFNKKYME